MTLLIRPVKMNKSLYVRVPNDIAHIIGLDNQVEVSFSFEDTGNELHLIYSLNKLQNHSESSLATHQTDSTAGKTSEHSLQEGRRLNGTKIEAESPPQT